MSFLYPEEDSLLPDSDPLDPRLKTRRLYDDDPGESSGIINPAPSPALQDPRQRPSTALSPEFTAAMDKVKQVLNERPERQKPSRWGAIAAMGIGAGAGFVNAGRRTQIDPHVTQGAIDNLTGVTRFRNNEADWKRRLEATSQAAQIEGSKIKAQQDQEEAASRLRLESAHAGAYEGDEARARALAGLPPRPDKPPLATTTAERESEGKRMGLSGRDLQSYVLTGRMEPQRPEPIEKPTLTDQATERTKLADEQGLTGRDRQVFITTGRVERPATPRTPAGAGGPDDAKLIAQGIVEGKQPPTLTGLYRNGSPVRAELQRQGYDLMTAQRDWTAVQKHLATLNGQQQERLRQAITFTYDSLDNIDSLYDEWAKLGGANGFKLLNRAALGTTKQIPGKLGEVATALEAQINDLTSELGTVYKGGNGSTDESLRLAAENLKADWNPAQFKRGMNQIRTNLKIRRNSILNSSPVGVTSNSPYAPPVDKQEPAEKPVPAGQVTVVDPRGKPHTFPNQAAADAFKREAGIP